MIQFLLLLSMFWATSVLGSEEFSFPPVPEDASVRLRGTCYLSYENRDIVVDAPCRVLDLGGAQMLLESSEFMAKVDNSTNRAALISGRFVLSKGRLVSNQPTRLEFQNYYVLEITVEGERRGRIASGRQLLDELMP